LFHLIPLPPSPLREGGKKIIISALAPLLQERGWGEVRLLREGLVRGQKIKNAGRYLEGAIYSGCNE
jgi:hypothetical protein